MTSARVAGGSAPAPLHPTWPDPQSPVAQDPDPDLSNLHPVRPQNLPDHPVGAVNVREEPFGSSNPVLSRLGLPAFDKIPGHTVLSHLFTNVNVAPDAPVASMSRARVKLRTCSGEEDGDECRSMRWAYFFLVLGQEFQGSIYFVFRLLNGGRIRI